MPVPTPSSTYPFTPAISLGPIMEAWRHDARAVTPTHTTHNDVHHPPSTTHRGTALGLDAACQAGDLTTMMITEMPLSVLLIRSCRQPNTGVQLRAPQRTLAAMIATARQLQPLVGRCRLVGPDLQCYPARMHHHRPRYDDTYTAHTKNSTLTPPDH
jgi:hypothetical protein